MRHLGAMALGLVVVACSASGDNGGGTGGSGNSGNVGNTGGSAAAGGGTGNSGNVGNTGGTHTGGSATGGNATHVCPQGAIICEGNTAKICDGSGGFQSETDCTGQVCAPNLGCVDCIPGEGSCAGGVATICNPDGMGTTEVYCDSLQGLTCNPTTFHCDGACSAENLEQSYVGCDYYPTVTVNQMLDYPSLHDFAVAVANTTPSTANVTVTRGAATVTAQPVAPNSVEIIPLPWIGSLRSATSTTMVADGAYRLRSDQPITVYQYNPLPYYAGGQYTYTNDASLLLPVTAWTGHYHVASRNHYWVSSPGFYAVTASQDNTTVTIVPSSSGIWVSPGAGVNANGTGTVVLSEGDVLQVLSASATGVDPEPSDLTGTRINADKPVQVIGGHNCIYIPYDHSMCCCDHLEESMPPLETLGLEYLVSTPLINANSSKGRMVRIIATQSGTSLSYDPPTGAPTSLANAGDYIEIGVTTTDFKITADKPVLVSQYMVGQSYPGVQSGDPAMTLAVPIAQYRTDYLFHAPTNYDANYVNVIAPSSTAVTLDGAGVSGWSVIGSTGYSVAKVQLSNAGDGNHVITSSLPFGITVYGYGQWTSFWYPGGLDLTPLGL